LPASTSGVGRQFFSSSSASAVKIPVLRNLKIKMTTPVYKKKVGVGLTVYSSTVEIKEVKKNGKSIPVKALELGAVVDEERTVIGEVPLALTFNRIPYVVMMVTPGDLEDFVRGFVATEGLLPADAGLEIELSEAEDGWLADLQVPAELLESILERRRNLVGQLSDKAGTLAEVFNLSQRCMKSTKLKMQVGDNGT